MKVSFYYIISVLVLFIVPAKALETCGVVMSVNGDSCSQFKTQFDLSTCEKNVGTITPTTECDGDNVVAIYKSKTANYRAVFELKNVGWGKKEYQLKGKIWRYLKVIKPVDTDIVKKVSEPEKPAVTNREIASVFAPAPLPPVPSKIKEDDLNAVVNLFSGLNIKGSIDFYYGVSSNSAAALSSVPTTASPLVQNKYHVFDVYHDDLQLSLARLQIQKRSDELTTTLDFGYGPAMQAVSGSKTDSAQLNLKQAIIGYKPTEKVNIEVGRFVTYLGFELIETQDNWNYSRGLLFGYFVPFWHQGVKITYSISDSVSVMGVIANGWNNSYDDNHQRSIGAQVAWTPSPDGALYLSVLSGPDAVPGNVNSDGPTDIKSVFDIVGTYKPAANLSLGINIDFLKHQKTATGAAVFLRYQLDPKWSIASRIETVEDLDNLAMGESITGGQKLSSYTLTLEKKLTPNLLFRVEGRVDTSSTDVFTNGSDVKSNQNVGLLGLTASF